MGGGNRSVDAADRPSLDDLVRCVRCGFCLPQCPTYLQLGLETDSPRGRIQLIRALVDDRVGPTASLARHLDLCLQCRACETACPSGVAYGRIIESARTMLTGNRDAPLSWRLRRWLLQQTVPYQKRLDRLFSLLRFYQRSPVRRVVRGTRVLRLLPGGLAEAETMLPEVPARPFEMASIRRSSRGPKGRVGLLTGCVMPLLYPRTHEATVRVLARHGFEVVGPPDQCCCGALNLHAGDRRTGRDLGRRNIDAFLEADVEAVIVNAAGCGAALKEYGELLAHDPAYADKARRFSGMVKDVTEFLVDLPLQPPQGAAAERVTYQDSCHLAHAQKISSAPRDILRAISGVELVEMDAPDRCCGNAGIYSFVQSEMSLRLLDDKMRDVAATGATVIATANPGCMIQLEAGLRRHGMSGRVVHVIELLDEAYRAEEQAEP